MRVLYLLLPLLLDFLPSVLATNGFHRDVVQNSVLNQHQPRWQRNDATQDSTTQEDELWNKATFITAEELRRKLANDDYVVAEDYRYSFQGYSLKYAKCQTIKRFSEDAVKNGEYSSLVTDDIVILRLCPYKACSQSKAFGCYYNYAEYAMNMGDYIKVMVKYTMEKQDNLCSFCATCNNRRGLGENDNNNNDNNNNKNENNDKDNNNNNKDNGDGKDNDNKENGDDNKEDENEEDAATEAENNQEEETDNSAESTGDDAISDCDTYAYDCAAAANTCAGNSDDDAGYVKYEDYLNYVECTKVGGQDKYGANAYFWIRPRCDPSAGTITMSIFYDPYCSQYAGGEVNLRDFSGIMFRKSMFQDFYSGVCIDCSETGSAPFYSSNSNMCNKVHRSSARCTNNLNYDIFGDSTDRSTECSFIESIRSGTYNSQGEVYVSSSELGFGASNEVTDAQKAGLVISIVLCCALAMYACYLHHSITNLLIKSLSHSHLLPPSRHRNRSRRRSGSSSSRGRRAQVAVNSEEDWDERTPKIV